MIQIDRKEACCGCRACAQICPKQCISMQEDEEGFWYPAVDRAVCVQCGLCEKVCPQGKTDAQQSTQAPQAYAACSREEDVRRESSSGGIFSLLARKVLSGQGVVYGAAMGSVSEVSHIRVASPEELPLLRGSKYVQSNIGKTYLQAREDLKAGIQVLFTGTPCQIEGLRAFLGKDFPNLICMDIICHGVPSPMVWRKYVQYRENRAKSPAVRAHFRNKRYGWKEYSLIMEFEDGSRYASSAWDDLFMQAYLRDLCLRPSCYECGFKKQNRVSDITVADFWGIERVCPQLDDGKGTSLVIVYSEKGSSLLCGLAEDMKYRQVDFSAAIGGNPSMLTPAKKPESRAGFLRDIRGENFRKVVRRYVKRRRTVKGIAKSVLRRLHRS